MMLVQKKGVELIKNQSKLILDVRNPGEVEQHTYMVRNTSDYKKYQVDLVNLKRCTYCYLLCRRLSLNDSGFFLQKEAFSNITNIQGGFSKLKEFDIQIVEGQSCLTNEFLTFECIERNLLKS